MKHKGFALIVGLVMMFATATSVWAAEEPKATILRVIEDNGNAASSFAPPVDEGIDGYGGNEALKERHREIDEILFKQHNGDFAEQGFRVAHTGPVGDVIEVGITPYEKEHVEAVLELIGEDMVRIVEGAVAVPFVGMADGAGPDAISPEIGVVNPPNNNEAVNAWDVAVDGAAIATDDNVVRTSSAGSGELLVQGASAMETAMNHDNGRSTAEIVGLIAAIAALLLAVTLIVKRPWIRHNKS